MTPTEELKHEHQIILLVLQRAEQMARSQSDLDAAELARIVEFLQGFADRCHHGKEEKHLFTRMAEHGFSFQQGPLAVMMLEHDQGRAHVRALAEALDRAGRGLPLDAAAVKARLGDYAKLLRDHIHKEDHILYPMADSAFSPEDQRALAEAFEKVEREEMGEGAHEKYHALAHRLSVS